MLDRGGRKRLKKCVFVWVWAGEGIILVYNYRLIDLKLKTLSEPCPFYIVRKKNQGKKKKMGMVKV